MDILVHVVGLFDNVCDKNSRILYCIHHGCEHLNFLHLDVIEYRTSDSDIALTYERYEQYEQYEQYE